MWNKILRHCSLCYHIEVCALKNIYSAMLVGTLHTDQYNIMKTFLDPISYQDLFSSLSQKKQGASDLKLWS